MNYKGFEVDDVKIDDYVERLDVSIIEACELILEEEGKIAESAETTKAINEDAKKANNGKRHYEKSDKPRKPSTKERKVDAEKGRLLSDVKVLIEGLGAENVTMKTETELSFDFNGNKYTFKLTKHRPPKK